MAQGATRSSVTSSTSQLAAGLFTAGVSFLERTKRRGWLEAVSTETEKETSKREAGFWRVRFFPSFGWIFLLLGVSQTCTLRFIEEKLNLWGPTN